MSIKSKKVLFFTGPTADKPLVYVIRGEHGDLMIDTAHHGAEELLDKWIDENGFDIKWLFLTHSHYDHTYNAVHLRERYGCRIIIHENDLETLAHRKIRFLFPVGEENTAKTDAANDTAIDNITDGFRPDITVSDSDTDFLRKLGFDADIVMLHGHTPGSMGILQYRTLYSGDACSAINGDYYTMPFGTDADQVRASEEKIFRINPLVIAPGHGRLVINEKAFPKFGESIEPENKKNKSRIILIAGATHTGKTVLAQEILEKYKIPYVSIDHIKMGLIRSGHTDLTPESSDEELTEYLWPIIREMIKTAIENGQNMTVEGCYVPFDWTKDFENGYIDKIRCVRIVFSEKYIREHYDDIIRHADDIENRVFDGETRENLIKDNRKVLEECRKYGADYVLADESYDVAERAFEKIFG